jgi:hypothetical protein
MSHDDGEVRLEQADGPEHTMRWFGIAWGAPINHVCPHAETPVGEACSHCTESIEQGDRGVLELQGDAWRPQHAECFVRVTVGSIDHMIHEGVAVGCSGLCWPDPAWLSRREAAEFVSRLVAYAKRGPVGSSIAREGDDD